MGFAIVHESRDADLLVQLFQFGELAVELLQAFQVSNGIMSCHGLDFATRFGIARFHIVSSLDAFARFHFRYHLVDFVLREFFHTVVVAAAAMGDEVGSGASQAEHAHTGSGQER